MIGRTFALLSMCTVAGCGDDTTPISQPANSADHAITNPDAADTEQTTSPDAAQINPTPPKFVSVEVFIFCKGYSTPTGETGTFSCTTRFRPQPPSHGIESKTASTCGITRPDHPELAKVAEVSWQYVRTDDEGDHYELERTFPLDQPNETSVTKQVVYAGTELLLFEDEFQRIVMRPASSD